METILLPQEYSEILNKHGIVHQYGKHWKCMDYKSKTTANIKSKRSFKISDAKILEISGDKLSFKSTYCGSSCEHSILKRGKKWANFKPKELGDINCVKDAKRDDVLKLLSELNVPGTVMDYYHAALANAGQQENTQDLIDSDDDDQ